MNMEELNESSGVENTSSLVVCVKSKEKRFSCSECGKSFHHKWLVQRHLRVHTQEKPYICSICEKSFSRMTNLSTHIYVHTKKKPLMCSECGKGFVRKDRLSAHIRTHEKEYPFSCKKSKRYSYPLCHRGFSGSGNVTKHMRVHTKEKPFKCIECGKGFAQKCTLFSHVRTHTLEKPYPCSVCGMSFRQKSSLNAHLRVHTGERPYLCGVCGMSFRQKPCLNAHLRVHTDEKPYSCSLCGRKFKQSGKLSKHIKKHNECNTIVSQKNLDTLYITSSGNGEAPVISAIHNDCSKNDENSGAFKSLESDETNKLCVQAFKHDPEISSDPFRSNPEKKEAAVCLQEIDFADEFITIKEEMVFPEDELVERIDTVNVLECSDVAIGSNNHRSLTPKPINLDFLLVKMEK